MKRDLGSKKHFTPSRSADQEFYRQIKKVAKNASHIISVHADGMRIRSPEKMVEALQKYSQLITPWARRQSARMIQSVSRSNMRAYSKNSKTIARELRNELAAPDDPELIGAPVSNSIVGRRARELQNEQVELITSIPIEAGLRAQKIAEENFYQGTRAFPDPEIVRQLQDQMGMTEKVAVNRAKLIARTETARANAIIQQARAESLGVTHYIWRTSKDGAVRDSHRQMEGEVIAYDDPPHLSDGTTTHAGQIYNCRCWQEPIIPDDY